MARALDANADTERRPAGRCGSGRAGAWAPKATAALLVAALITAGAGCRRSAGPPPDAPEVPVIPVSTPVEREITDYVYYTGRTDAVQSVEVRSRVTGYLVKLPFKEGAEVKKGDLLFEIDPRPYQVELDAAKAQVQLKEANYRLNRSENARSRAIARNVSGSISQEELEKSSSLEAQAQADLSVAKANLDAAKLNLDYTRVTSPIDGHVSRYYYTLGNLVTQDQTLLTTVVSADPIYAYFDMDERTVLRLRTLINEGKLHPPRDTTEVPVDMGLEAEEGYPHRGTLNFVNNTVSLSTGTLTVRGVFANPKPDGGRRLITPGMFARIRLPVGTPHRALLVTERAIGSDQGARYVYVVDARKTVQYRRVTPGALQDDGLRAIEQGLNRDDRVVVGGLPQVRPRMQIDPEPMPMPSATGEPGPAASAATGTATAPAGTATRTAPAATAPTRTAPAPAGGR